jgi:capsular polysaccharide transport system permease protein
MTAATFRENLRVQGSVVGALIMRELHTRYGRDNVGYVWLLLEPLLLASMIALLHSQSPSHFGSDIKPVPLSILGYCVFITFRSIVNRSEGALEANLPLLYHKNVTVFDILIARAVLEAAGTTMSLVVLMSLSVVLGMANLPERPLFVLLALACMFILSFGTSMIVCAGTHDKPAIGRLVHPISYVLMPLSGAFFCVEWFTPKIQAILSWVPLVHIFELLRYGYFRTATPQFIDPIYLTGWLLGTLLIGLLSISLVRARVHLA